MNSYPQTLDDAICAIFAFEERVTVNPHVSLLDLTVEAGNPAPDDTAYKRWNCHSGFGKMMCKLCRNLPHPASRSCGPIKEDDVETTEHKQICICDIGHKQIHRKQMNKVHLVHPSCAGIRLAHIQISAPAIYTIRTHNSHRYNTTPPFNTLV